MKNLTINGQESTVTSSYSLRCIGSSSKYKENESVKLVRFLFLKKLIFGLDKRNFNDKIVSFIHLGGKKYVICLVLRNENSHKV